MSMNIGIIGLPKSGKTTIFNALTRGKVDTGSYTPKSLAPHIGIAKVPEPRLKILADTVSGQLLAQLTTVDTLINVVRAFTDDRIPHVEGSLDVARDIATMDLELAFSDLTIIERRLKRIDISLKGAKPPEHQGLLREHEILMKIKADLEKDVPIRELGLTTDEARIITHYQFLTDKPLLIAVNIGEEQLPEAASLEAELSARYLRPRSRVITLCGR